MQLQYNGKWIETPHTTLKEFLADMICEINPTTPELRNILDIVSPSRLNTD